MTMKISIQVVWDTKFKLRIPINSMFVHFLVCLSIYVSNAIMNPPKRNNSDKT